MCISPVKYEVDRYGEFIFTTKSGQITLNLLEVSQFSEWCRQICHLYKSTSDDNEAE